MPNKREFRARSKSAPFHANRSIPCPWDAQNKIQKTKTMSFNATDVPKKIDPPVEI